MKKSLALPSALAASLFFASAAHADKVFDLSAHSTWTKVEAGEVQQWTIVVQESELVQLDVVWDDDTPAVYLVRRPCDGPSEYRHFGDYSFAIFKPGDVLGYGLDCDGLTMADGSINHLLTQVGEPPEEVQQMLAASR